MDFIGSALLVLQDDIQSMDDAGNVTEDSQEDVDEQVRAAAALEEDAKRGQDDGKDDLADVASGESHSSGCFLELGAVHGLSLWR